MKYTVRYGQNGSSQSFRLWADACKFMRYLLADGVTNVSVSKIEAKR